MKKSALVSLSILAILALVWFVLPAASDDSGPSDRQAKVQAHFQRLREMSVEEIIRHALQRDLPVLGICRGAQLMNVSLGGSLHQDIGHFYTEDTNNVRSILPRKAIAMGSRGKREPSQR